MSVVHWLCFHRCELYSVPTCLVFCEAAVGPCLRRGFRTTTTPRTCTPCEPSSIHMADRLHLSSYSTRVLSARRMDPVAGKQGKKSRKVIANIAWTCSATCRHVSTTVSTFPWPCELDAGAHSWNQMRDVQHNGHLHGLLRKCLGNAAWPELALVHAGE